MAQTPRQAVPDKRRTERTPASEAILYRIAKFYAETLKTKFPVRPAANPVGGAGDAIALGDSMTLYATGTPGAERYRLCPFVLADGTSVTEEEAAASAILESDDPRAAVRDALIAYVQDGCDEAARRAKDNRHA